MVVVVGMVFEVEDWSLFLDRFLTDWLFKSFWLLSVIEIGEILLLIYSLALFKLLLIFPFAIVDVVIGAELE